MNKSKNTITPKQNQELITEKKLSIIEEKLIDGMTLSEIINDKQYPFSLMKFYHYLKRNPELEKRILEARKLGIQTLIDKLLQVFSYQENETRIYLKLRVSVCILLCPSNKCFTLVKPLNVDSSSVCI